MIGFPRLKGGGWLSQTVTAQIGAIAVSRGVAKTDMALSDEALQAVRETIDAALRAPTASIA
ncbi:MAG: hypothetical protein WDN29_06185 [Methylovirgula sp.]